MIIPCELAFHECRCDDFPIVNLSAEEPDTDVFIGFRDFRGQPPLGILFAQIGCKSICFSTVSQDDANDCALRQAQTCTWITWRQSVFPPIPPPPGGGPGNGGFNTPGGIPPSNPRFPFSTFSNTQQSCDVLCPDGQPFTEVIAAGTIKAPSQPMADEMAHSLACKRALVDAICFLTDDLPASCIGDSYLATLQAVGGTSFATHQFDWQVTGGDFPPGLDLNVNTGRIEGFPFVNGSYTFTVTITDAKGKTQSKEFTICIMEIVTEANLPKATQDTPYAQPLVEEPGTVSSETWVLVGGSLPPGIDLASNGALNGTPTDLGTFSFTLKVTADCSGEVSCTKSFSLEVESGVDCMGEAQEVQDIGLWTQISSPLAGTITVLDGDGTFSGVDPSNPFVEARCLLCNPHMDPYDFTVEIDWTIGGFVGFINTQAIVRLNGVDHPSAVFNSNGARVFNTGPLPLPSGVNTINVYCTASGIFAGTLNGTVTVRPLTPP